jgi:hypothetical protein
MKKRTFSMPRPTWREGFLAVARKAESTHWSPGNTPGTSISGPSDALRPAVLPLRRKSLAAAGADA